MVPTLPRQWLLPGRFDLAIAKSLRARSASYFKLYSVYTLKASWKHKNHLQNTNIEAIFNKNDGIFAKISKIWRKASILRLFWDFLDC